MTPREIKVKSLLNKTKRRDPWFLEDYTLNLYSSCSFNCLYCYIRGSKYGSNLEESLSVKINAIELLEQQLALRARKNQFGFIILSSATDPYLSIEKKYELTRQALEVIARYRFPVHLLTKSDLIERDFDLLHQIDRQARLPEDLHILQRGAILSFSFSTLDDQVAAIFEPGATPPSRRLLALQKTVAEGFLCGVSLMPLLPFISDTSEHLHLLFSTFQASRVDYVLPATLSLYGEGKADSKTLVMKAFKKYYPHLEKKYSEYFAYQTEMPAYYCNAFYAKMKELGASYQLPLQIKEAAKLKALK